MTKIKNINDYTHIFLHKIVTLIIKYATEEDVETLLYNAIDDVNYETYNKNLIDTEYSMKENLIYSLIFDIWEDTKRNNCNILTAKNIIRQSLFTHLNSIGVCYYNYYFPDQTDGNEPKFKLPIKEIQTKEPLFGMRKIKVDLNEVYNAEKLKNYEIPQILHKIISNYTKNHFYYAIIDNSIYKIEIELKPNNPVENCVANKITQYILNNRDRYPCIIDKETGLEISIGRQIKLPFKLKKGTLKLQGNTFESFMGTNERIIKALTFKPNPCHWCTPDKDSKNEKIKCDNCRNLLDALNNLAAKCKDDKIKQINFNSLISSVGYTKAKNIADLRNQRKKLLYSFLNNAKKYVKDENIITNIKFLIDKSFDLTIKY